jgi:hypothetical protein
VRAPALRRRARGLLFLDFFSESLAVLMFPAALGGPLLSFNKQPNQLNNQPNTNQTNNNNNKKGNHDWIDGLETFTKQVQHKGWLGGWLLPQVKRLRCVLRAAGCVVLWAAFCVACFFSARFVFCVFVFRRLGETPPAPISTPLSNPIQ